MPRVTVVLPVYNHELYVEEAIRSLQAQDYRDFQIVAVNDGSTDASLEILHRNWPTVIVIESKHQGPAATRNIAIRRTDSELVAFMDADDVCAPKRLCTQIELLQKDKAHLVASAMDFIDSDGRPLPGKWACPEEGANWGALLERNWIGTPSVIVRRDVLDKVGLFDEGFTHAEDYDLWLRIGRKHAISYIDSPLVHCRRHPTNTSKSIDSHHHFEQLALQRVNLDDAWAAFDQLYRDEHRRAEAWIWFLLRRSDALLHEEILLARAAHPHSPGLQFAEGVFQCDSGQYKEALAAFNALSESDVAAQHNAGVVHALRGDLQSAKTHMEAALQRRPDYHDAQYNLDALCRGQAFRLTRRPFREHVVPVIGHG